MALDIYSSLRGRLTRDPQLEHKTTRNGDRWLLRLGLAQNHTDGSTDFAEATMWFEDRTVGATTIHAAQEATRVAEMLRKGDDVVLAGQLRTAVLTDEEGQEYEREEFRVYQVSPDTAPLRMRERITITRLDAAGAAQQVTAQQIAATSPFPAPASAQPQPR